MFSGGMLALVGLPPSDLHLGARDAAGRLRDRTRLADGDRAGVLAVAFISLIGHLNGCSTGAARGLAVGKVPAGRWVPLALACRARAAGLRPPRAGPETLLDRIVEMMAG